jgi:RNA polymerase sigma-70 factor, ECF subfamily
MTHADLDRSSLTDDTLVRMSRRGDEEAFSELIRRHRQKCVDVATCYLRNRGDAEDEAQNAFSQAFKHLDQFQADAEFSTWLCRIVANQCLMLLRSRRRAHFVYIDEPVRRDRALPVELPASAADPEGELAYRQVMGVLRRELRRIPSLLRRVIELHDIQELPMMEVAEQLGITLPAAKSRLIRGRTELRSRVSVHCPKTRTGDSLSRCAAPLSRVAPNCTLRVS